MWFHHNISDVPETLVFSHDTSGGLFENKSDAQMKNTENPSAKLYSILRLLETFRQADGSFHLKLCYPGLTAVHDPPCNEWTQTSNPATVSNITGFTPISIVFKMTGTGGSFGGLGLSIGSIALLCDTPTSAPNWWSAIGALHQGVGTCGFALEYFFLKNVPQQCIN